MTGNLDDEIRERFLQLPEEFTREEKVLRFLELTKDNNEIHREPHRILPGMFYLVLAYPFISKGDIESTGLKFRSTTKYPTNLDLHIKETEKTCQLEFGQKDKIFSECEVVYSKHPTEKRKNWKFNFLKTFADFLGADIDGEYENIAKIWYTCLIPGSLGRYLNSTGVYMTQDINFIKIAPRLKLRISTDKVRGDGKIRRLRTDYEFSPLFRKGKMYAKGFAKVAAISA